jgi:tRNA G18 (ribose-2'-O)-methylase SpoU
MVRVPINDLDDPRIAIYRHLKTTNQTRRVDQFVVEGQTLLMRLVASPFPLASVLATERFEARVAPLVPAAVPLYVLPHGLIRGLVGFSFHRGVLACAHRRAGPSLDEIVCCTSSQATLVVCPRLDNPENLGAIIRLGDTFGVKGILVGGRCPDPLSRRVLRVSMGGALRLPVLGSDDLERDLDRLGSEFGFELIAAVADPGTEPLDTVRCAGRFALLLGSEAEGLAAHWLARCARRITIPMRSGSDSLNVAVAAGILLYYLQRDRL